jgi:hypothetical protein
MPKAAPIGAPDTDDAGAPTARNARALIHEASLKTETREVPVKPVAEMPQSTVSKSADRPVTAAKPVKDRSADKPGLAAAKPAEKKADKKSVDKPAAAMARSVTKPTRVAKVDPLAPLDGKAQARTSKDSPRTQ